MHEHSKLPCQSMIVHTPSVARTPQSLGRHPQQSKLWRTKYKNGPFLLNVWLYLTYLFLTKHLTTQSASCMDLSASSRTSLLDPLTIMLTVLATLDAPVNCVRSITNSIHKVGQGTNLHNFATPSRHLLHELCTSKMFRQEMVQTSNGPTAKRLIGNY